MSHIPALLYWINFAWARSLWQGLDQPLGITNYTNVHSNPLALREVRFAFNYLIDREPPVPTILGGSGTPQCGAIRPDKVLATATIFHANGTKLADIPNDTITVVFNIPAASPWIVIPKGDTPYYIIYTIDYEGPPNYITGYAQIGFYTTYATIPKEQPEPTILPLILPAAISPLLLIRRKKE